MLMKHGAWWTNVLLYTVHVIIVNGFIEIVEEQRCHDIKIRLTCRDLDAHIAVLEAWYTSIGDYRQPANISTIEDTRFENDTELDRVYMYASPMNNGVYELINNTTTDNVTDLYTVDNDVKYPKDSFGVNETVDEVELVNVSDMCNVTYSKRYASWESERRRLPVIKGSSINLLEPLRNRCSGATHCSFVLKKTFPLALDWLPGIIHIKYSCSNEIVEEQRCSDSEIRLTCRELDAHIAVLEAWYTSMEDYSRNLNVSDTPENFTLKTENDSELDRVYVYSSPNHNGVYELTNSSVLDNVTDYLNVNNYFDDSNVTDSMRNETVDVTVEFVNGSEMCGLLSYTRSYASWHDGGKRQRPFARSNSINLRAPLSYRCTGVNHCNFLLEEDYPPAVHWPPGVVSIKYACFDDSLAVHYCNREVRIAEFGPDSEGYIRTPGYPHFYVGDECRWRLKTNPEQRIRVSLLDVSLRSIGPFEDQCTDSVSVLDSNGDSLLSTCEQVYLPLTLTSTTNTVEVMVEAKSQGAFPKRGVLLHYKSIGCVTLPAPSDGYLVYRTEDVAHYMCNVNFVFADTLQRARMLWCFNDNKWNETIPLCIEETTKKVVGNVSSEDSPDKDTKLPHNEANMIVDIVIPSLLIAALFIGNAFIVLIIYKYRKRKTEDLDDEFNTIPLSVNGGMHSAGNAV